MCNYADDCCPYETSLPLEDVINKLDENSMVLMECYESNYLKPNQDKWYLLLSEMGDKHAVLIGISLTHLAPKIWEQIPAEMKCYKTLKLFKSKIKTGFARNTFSMSGS